MEKFWKALFGCKITGLGIWLNCWHCTIADASTASPSFIFLPISAVELDIALIAASVELVLSSIVSMTCLYKANSSLVKSICLTSLWCDDSFFFISSLTVSLTTLSTSLVSVVLLFDSRLFHFRFEFDCILRLLVMLLQVGYPIFFEEDQIFVDKPFWTWPGSFINCYLIQILILSFYVLFCYILPFFFLIYRFFFVFFIIHAFSLDSHNFLWPEICFWI